MFCPKQVDSAEALYKKVEKLKIDEKIKIAIQLYLKDAMDREEAVCGSCKRFIRKAYLDGECRKFDMLVDTTDYCAWWDEK